MHLAYRSYELDKVEKFLQEQGVASRHIVALRNQIIRMMSCGIFEPTTYTTMLARLLSWEPLPLCTRFGLAVMQVSKACDKLPKLNDIIKADDEDWQRFLRQIEIQRPEVRLIYLAKAIALHRKLRNWQRCKRAYELAKLTTGTYSEPLRNYLATIFPDEEKTAES